MPGTLEHVPDEFVTKTTICDYKIPLVKMLGKIENFGAVVVNKNSEYYGIVDLRSIYSNVGRLGLNQNAKIEKFADRVPVLDDSTSINQAIANFYYSAKKFLPYSKENKIIGVIKREKLLSTILSLHLLSKYDVNLIATSPVISIDSNSNAAQARKLMLDNHINKLAVTENEKLFGILTDKNMNSEVEVNSERQEGKVDNKFSLSNIKVSSICEKNLYTINKTDPIDLAIKLLLEKDISSLFIMKNQVPVGIVTTRDIFELVLANTNISKDNIIISGLDDSTKEYEDEIREELQKLMDNVNKFHGMQTHYLSLNIKKHKEKNYEIKARLISTKNGTFTTAISGYSLEQGIKETSEKMYKIIKEKRDKTINNQTKRGKIEYEE
jgi:predicted transcriptional regulator